MIQTLLMFLALPQNAARTDRQVDRPALRMATRAKPAQAQCLDEGRNGSRDEHLLAWPAVVGNALGFALLMTGLWLVLCLVETLLA